MGKRRREEEYKERFKKGSAVEVSSEDSGLRGSWYTATVIRSISATTHKILVEYHNLYSDDSGCTKLREFVDAILVRPIPPRHPRLFSLMDDVDAFHNDGWWEGVVTRVFPHHSLYSVFFRCSREQIDFPPSDLRLHREWLHHNLWLPPFHTPPSPPPPPPPPPSFGSVLSVYLIQLTFYFLLLYFFLYAGAGAAEKERIGKLARDESSCLQVQVMEEDFCNPVRSSNHYASKKHQACSNGVSTSTLLTGSCTD